MRGTGSCRADDGIFDGITPAGAGNSLYRGPEALLVQDHPRGCGEQYLIILHGKAIGGSPPRVRGTGSEPSGQNV